MQKLHKTPMGRKFFETDFPKLVEEIHKLNENLKNLSEKREECH